MPNRFLFLDDDPRRHEHFDRMNAELDTDVIHVWTVEECVRALTDCPRFDCVFLDHDLGGRAFVKEAEGTGTEVAYFIRDELPDEKLPGAVVIHSWNTAGAKRMKEALLTRLFSVKCMPFEV